MTKSELYNTFADFFNENPDRLVNDRWSLPKTINNQAVWRGDFLTPEYTLIDTEMGGNKFNFVQLVFCLEFLG